MCFFSKNHKNLWLISTCLVFVFSINIAFTDNNTPEEKLPFKAMVSINWEIDQNVTVNNGGLMYTIEGTLEIDKTGSKEVKTKEIPSAFPFVTYRPSIMKVVYGYCELINEKDPGNCPALTAIYQKDMGSFYLESGYSSQSRAELNIRKIGSMIPEGYDLPNIPEMPTPMSFCDYYEFYAAGPQQMIQGEERGSDCKYEKAEKEIVICRLGLRFQLPEDGAISGKREWCASADKSGLTFKISLSDLPAPLSDEEYYPDPDPEGDIDYCVVWGIGEQGISECNKMINDKNKKRDCDELQKRIDFINIVRKVYANNKLRQYAKEHFPNLDDATDKYQTAVEKLSMKISIDPELKNPSAMDDYLNDLPQTDVVKAFEPIQGSAATTYLQTMPKLIPNTKTIYNISIVAFREGVPVDLIIYDAKGVKISETKELGNMEREWINDYWSFSQKVGQSRFWSCIDHERTHVRQYAKNGLIKSVDDLAERELEAYQAEIDSLKSDRDEMGCK